MTRAHFLNIRNTTTATIARISRVLVLLPLATSWPAEFKTDPVEVTMLPLEGR
jgi:hypothetical protein